MALVSGTIDRINQTSHDNYALFYFTLEGVHAGYIFQLHTASLASPSTLAQLILTKPGDKVEFDLSGEPRCKPIISDFTNTTLNQHAMATPEKIEANKSESLGL